MNQDRIMEILQNEDQASIFATGYLTALRVNNLVAPYDIEHEPCSALTWTVSQVLIHFITLSNQMRRDTQCIMDACGNFAGKAAPEWLVAKLNGAGLLTADPNTNPVATEQSHFVIKPHPALCQVMEAFQSGEAFLTKLNGQELRELSEMLLTANADLRNAPFWNEIDAYVDAQGNPLPTMSLCPSKEQELASVELKRRYLSRVVIPECLRLVANHIGQKVFDACDDGDAARLARLLKALPDDT